MMDLWNTFKDVLKKSQGPCIIVAEGNNPKYAILDFKDFQKLLGRSENNGALERNVLEANIEIETEKAKEISDSKNDLGLGSLSELIKEKETTLIEEELPF